MPNDLYYDPDWESEHPYLAGLFRELMQAPGWTLFAHYENVCLILQRDDAQRLLLRWTDIPVSCDTREMPTIEAWSLSDLFEEAAKNYQLEINEQAIPLDEWKLEM